MNSVLYIGLGSNIGHRILYLKEAQNKIVERVGVLIKASSYYETIPWGFDSTDLFINQVICVDTKLSAQEVLKQLHQIEYEAGRNRTKDKYSSRTLDLDILFYGDEIIVDENIEIPHPRIALRKFVLIPLMEINKKLLHPVLKKSVQQLYEVCEDQDEPVKIDLV